MPTLHELKKQVKELEAQAQATEQAAQKTTVETVPEDDSIEKMVKGIKGIFDQYVQESGRRLVDKNTVSKCCPECYLTQAIENDVCCLCGATPKAWLLAEDAEPDGPGRAAYEERRMFKSMATNSTIEGLKIALRSGWARTPEREAFAAKILELRLREKMQVEQPTVEEKPKPAEVGITDYMVKSAIKYCELQVKKLDEELAELNRQSAT
jgi:ferredoxin-thioredoxin reductase catalytic subunit